ncbi:hypothetical protein QFZ34_001570 [Phyllobacterium ifriqiyense]|uniref:Dienelactone hydrolase family protein n=1 Tax=Phyllobacterium ifriqiyense TaxID=314238 RepID=A0ABU0S6K3_9HYPH|nr:hypothetical protein [Phyllobacterium ifriqiyense]
MSEPTKHPNITQAMVDAFDEYTHLTLDRRSFMDKLTKLAGSGAAAAVIAPMLAANSAQAAIIAPEDKRLFTKDLVFAGPSGDIKAIWLFLPMRLVSFQQLSSSTRIAG